MKIIDIDRIYGIESLEDEGLINDLTRAIQIARKDLGLRVEDSICLSILSSSSRLLFLFCLYKDHIKYQTSVSILNFIPSTDTSDSIELKFYTDS